jgi:hypothetical protein
MITKWAYLAARGDMPIYFNKRSQWSVLVRSPKIYPVSCFDAYIFSVEARFSLETLYQLPPFLEKVIRALGSQLLP